MYRNWLIEGVGFYYMGKWMQMQESQRKVLQIGAFIIGGIVTVAEYRICGRIEFYFGNLLMVYGMLALGKSVHLKDNILSMIGSKHSLGDNIFAGHGLKKRLQAAAENAESGKGATVFGYYVDDPERFGIVEFDKNGKAVSIEEKPEHPKSNYCVTGLYFYDNRVVDFAKNLKPSARGELEITDLNRIYLEEGSLNVELLGQGFTWLDTGTHESLVDATNFVKTVEQHQHRKIACLEEIAYLNGWISKDELMEVYEVMKKNQYGQYLKDVMDGKYQEHLY